MTIPSQTASMRMTPRFGSTAAIAGTAARQLMPSMGAELLGGLHRRLGIPFVGYTLTDFLAGVMLVDVFALWLPRAYNALFRGAMDYKPSEDPIAQRKQGLNKFLYTTHERFKRLNWPNFIEECGREFASGPGFFIWPTLILSGAALKFFNPYKTGLHLGHHDITSLGKVYQSQLGEKSLESMKKKGSWTGEFQKFVHNIIDEDALLKDLKPEDKATYSKQLKQITADLEKHLTDYRNDPTAWAKRIGGNIKRWFNKTPDTTPLGMVEKTQQQLVNLVEDINKHNVFGRHIKENWLPVKNKIFTLETAAGEHSVVKVGDFTKKLARWFDVHHAFEKQVENLPKGFTGTTLGQLVEHADKRLMKTKTGYMIATVALTIGFLFKLVTWTQHHDSYVANRNLDLVGTGAANNGLKPLMPMPSRSNPNQLMSAFQRFASSPVTTSSPFSALATEMNLMAGDTFAGNQHAPRRVTSGGPF